jgi:hypothetical protein
MDKPPTKAKPSAEPEDAPEQLDADVRRDVLRAAETCRDRFEASPSHHAYKLGEILEALGRYPHLIDAVHRFMDSKDCPSKVPGIAPIVAIGGVRVRRVAMTKDPQTGEDVPVEDDDGLLVYQRIGKGRQWEGPSIVRVTARAIEDYSDPLDVAAAVIRHLPPLLRADCRDANRDPDQVGLAIAHVLDDPYQRQTPEKVLRAILKELGHPRPDNVTR